MPVLQHFCEWVYTTHLSTSIRQSPYSFPLIETIHTVGIGGVVGTVAILDLRLLGWIMKKEPVSRIARQVLPWTWAGFAVMFVTGLLLSIAESQTNYYNLAFRIKLLLLLLVGINPLIFHLTIYRKVNTWDVANVTPLRARLAAISSLVLWAGIIVAGRLIAYVNT
ncbi:hypothetical protein SAMN05421770_104168 [Granulicella rosea]|uniref:DUF6644 domain-containing protein n=1 Tax=Granulicella rosea TaxID=474952 RepID=A0A239JW81_9BACT|nr:DUF6644 family protein [Granulicella rosea]SNT10131.1 hypothetical protein SAMN05421770_104168 [Granulicella rosea]